MKNLRKVFLLLQMSPSDNFNVKNIIVKPGIFIFNTELSVNKYLLVTITLICFPE